MITLPLHNEVGLGDCNRCPLDPTAAVHGYGQRGNLALIGEAPGANEVRLGKPFMGISGKLIRELLMCVGVSPDSVWWSNAALCRPPGNKTPALTSVAACNDRLFRELAFANPTKILSLGASALTALHGASKPHRITSWRGKGFWTPVNGRDVYTVATYHPAACLRNADLFRDMVTDVEKLLANDAPLPHPQVEAWVAFSEKEALEYIEEIVSTDEILSCDIETTGFDPRLDILISLGIGYASEDGERGAAVIIPQNLIGSQVIKDRLIEILEGRTFHNGKFDLKFIEKILQHTFDLMHDTMLMNYTMDERPMGQHSTHSLKTLARIHFDADDYSWDWNGFFKDPEKYDLMKLYKYQALDCYYTARLHRVLWRQMDSEAKHLYHDTLLQGSRALQEVEQNGVLIDIPYLQQLQRELTTDIDEIRSQIQSDVESLTGVSHFNPASPDQVKEFFTAVGIKADDTKKETLNELLKTEPESIRVILRALLDFRNNSKLLSTYVTGFLSRVSEDGRIRGDFLLHGTVTGRLSSRNPNLQNIPHHGGGDAEASKRGDRIRRAFRAADGFTFVEADYSQLELRVAAYYSSDRLMQQTFVDNVDIHLQVASQMFRKPIEEISKQERHLAKYFDFGLVYGRSARSLAEGREMDLIQLATGRRWTTRDAEVFMQRFLGGFPDLAAWMRSQRRAPHKDHVVSTPTGRRRRFDLVLQDGLSERQAINSPIQALASDICLHSLIRLRQVLPSEEVRILFTVHDAIAFEVRSDRLEENCRTIKQVMEDVQIIDTDIPFVVEIKAGPNWTETEELQV